MKYMLSAFVVIAVVAVVFFAAHANPPNAVGVKYDTARGELDIQVEHVVSDRKSHYIEKVVVMKNGVEVASRSFESQTSSRNQTMPPIRIPAVSGDNFKVTATCNKRGSGERTITVE